MIIDVVYQTDEAVSIPQYTWRQGCIQPLPPSWMTFARSISLRAAYVPLGTACPIIAVVYLCLLVVFQCCWASVLLLS